MHFACRITVAVGLASATAVSCFAEEPVSSGTGFAATVDGWILTNAHVIEGCGRIEVKGRGDATDTRADVVNDLAAVKIAPAAPLRPLAFRNSPTRLGEDIVAIGYPLATLLADSVKITTGNVNALAGIRNDTRYLQISTPIQPGNSGGPVVDRSGSLIGIATATLSKKTADEIGITAQNVNFAIRASVAELFLQSQSLKSEATYPSTETKLLSTADLADLVTPSVFQVLCYRRADPRNDSAAGMPPIVPQLPRVAPVNLPTEEAGSANGKLDVPRARDGFVRHPKGTAPLKQEAKSEAKTLGYATNGSPVEIIELLGDWYRVAVGRSVGYLHYSWVRVSQFEEPGGDGRYVQVKSFKTLADARSFIRRSAVPLAAHLAASGWIAVTLPEVYEEWQAKDLANALKAKGLIAADAMVTFGNTYVRKVCCD